MPIRYISLVTAILLTFGPIGGLALAQTAMQAKPDWKERFRAHDRNGDGRIDRAEYQEWMIEVFYVHDKARKGYLIVEDVRQVMSVESFKAANRKGDGKLVLPEFLNAVFVDFEAADVNKNGSVTMEEIEAYISRVRK